MIWYLYISISNNYGFQSKGFKKLSHSNNLRGLLSAVTVLFIWSGWLIVSKYGASLSLTVFDYMAIRYGVSSIITLPILLYLKPWRGMPITRIIILTLLLGPFYTFCVFSAFEYAPAAHGGIFMNGAFPMLTILLSIYFFKETPVKIQFLGIFLILLGATFSTIDGSNLQIETSWIGDILFFISAIFFAFYLIVCRLWNVSLLQIIMCSSIFNGIIYLPLWLLFFSPDITNIGSNELYIQLIYQGLVPNLLGLLLLAIAVRNIGPNSTAAILAGVPALGTLLGFLILGESPGLIGILGILTLTPGILIISLLKDNSQ